MSYSPCSGTDFCEEGVPKFLPWIFHSLKAETCVFSIVYIRFRSSFKVSVENIRPLQPNTREVYASRFVTNEVGDFWSSRIFFSSNLVGRIFFSLFPSKLSITFVLNAIFFFWQVLSGIFFQNHPPLVLQEIAKQVVRFCCPFYRSLRLRFFGISSKPPTSRGLVTKALPSGLRFEVRFCMARPLSRGNWFTARVFAPQTSQSQVWEDILLLRTLLLINYKKTPPANLKSQNQYRQTGEKRRTLRKSIQWPNLDLLRVSNLSSCVP